jgi:hypothetical protein
VALYVQLVIAADVLMRARVSDRRRGNWQTLLHLCVLTFRHFDDAFAIRQ